jgi:hypothetical protein
MIRSSLILVVALAAGCAGRPLHVAPRNLYPESRLLCLAPDGSRAEWTLQLDRIRGEETGICPAPARFVAISPCAAGRLPPEEGPELWAARARAARDESLVGDSFRGQAYCLVPEPR